MVFYVTVFESSACEKRLTAVRKDDKDHEEQRGIEDEKKRPLLPMKQKDNGKEKVSNLLFVESPAGVGWSYSNTTSDYNCGDASSAKDNLLFLLVWYKKFPEYKSRDLFLTGESYAGHYIPQLAVAMLNHNQHSTGFKFNLKGVAIGNPLLKLDNDIAATYEYFWSHGMISDEIVGDYINNYDVILDVCYPSIVEQELRLRKSATKISIGVDVCMT